MREVTLFGGLAKITDTGKFYRLKYLDRHTVTWVESSYTKYSDPRTNKVLGIKVYYRDDRGKQHNFVLGSLMLQTFGHPKPKKYPAYVIYKDGNYRNNRLSNLRWVTLSEMNKSCKRCGRFTTSVSGFCSTCQRLIKSQLKSWEHLKYRGALYELAKKRGCLTDRGVDYLKYWASDHTYAEVGEHFGVNLTTISANLYEVVRKLETVGVNVKQLKQKYHEKYSFAKYLKEGKLV